MTATAAPISTLVPFACPVCGRLRDISPRALRAVTTGVRTGECTVGKGCRRALDPAEKLRRWWLRQLGVEDLTIRSCGSAMAYVDMFGMPKLPHTSRPAPRIDIPAFGRRFAGDALDLEVRAKLNGTAPAKAWSMPSLCFDQAGGDPELALWLAVEIVARGLPVEALAEAAAA